MQNVAIIGTTGSIGKAFLEYYVSDNTTEKVYSISRSKNNVEDKKIVNLDLNLTNKNDYAKLSSFIPKNCLDKVIIASGILHDDDLQPEKTISSLDLDNFQKISEFHRVFRFKLQKTQEIKKRSMALALCIW